jgi:DNA-binding HxlR family transcriptional regulator
MQVTRPRQRKIQDPKPKTRAHGFLRSPCAVACTLDLVGDKWSLLVVRDLLGGSRTYGELQNSREGIPTNILADRLKRLEDSGLIARSAYQQHPVRHVYSLTKKGMEFRDVLGAVVRWGKKHIPGTLALQRPSCPVRNRELSNKQHRNS